MTAEVIQEKREDWIAQLLWNSQTEGLPGFGLCRISGMDAWDSQALQRDKPDWPAIVCVTGPPEKYTDEELRRLAEFARAETARYDRLFGVRRGANLICFDKREDGRWMRKRLSAYTGPMYSPSLEHAIWVMTASWLRSAQPPDEELAA